MPILDLSNTDTPTVGLLVTVSITLLTFILWNSLPSSTGTNLPPGPFSLPIVGTLPFLGVDVREPLRRLSGRYGDIFTIYFGARRVIILNSYEAIKEAFVKNGEALAGRPQDLLMIELQAGRGIFASEGEMWHTQRSLTRKIFREFADDQIFMEDRIRDEGHQLRKYFSEHIRVPFDPCGVIQAAVANVIHSLVFGCRTDYDDPEFGKYMQLMNNSFEMAGSSGALTVFPFLRYLPCDFFRYKKLVDSVEYMYTQYKRYVGNHLNTYTPGKVRDFVDAYIKAMEEEEVGAYRRNSRSVDQLVTIVSDLIGGGTETTTATLCWAIVYLLRYPDVQERLQKEIDDVIGQRLPTKKDLPAMPYVEACIHEIQRISDIVPLGVPHSTLTDVRLGGFDIPKGTTVVANLYSVHFDPKLWDNPHKFDPNRFLDAEGKVHRKDKIVPFSIGKRVCLGESLARMELFLFFTMMLQNFSFRLPEGESLPGQSGILGMTHMPKKFRVVLMSRTCRPTNAE